jgi:hypothetical protein
MSDLRAAAQQALKAFRKCVPMDGKHAEVDAAFKSLRDALFQEGQEPAAWSTRERFYEALDRAVGNVRQEMRIKTVTMRRKDHDIALPIIDAYSGHVLVGDPPRREWQGLTENELGELMRDSCGYSMWVSPDTDALKFSRAIEAALKEKNT